MLKEKIGLCIFSMGICMANSEWLIVPISLVVLGAWLMRGLAHEYDTEEDQ